MMEEGYTTGFSGSAIIRSLQGQDHPRQGRPIDHFW